MTDEGAQRSPSATLWRRLASWAALGFAWSILLLRFVYAGQDSLTYDEATYADLAEHPWWSSFYPDQIFVRHPPLYFLFMMAWVSVTDGAELVLRMPGLLFGVAGAALVWDAVRRTHGPTLSVLAGVLLATSFHLIVYAVQVSMYPLAFFWVALAMWARSRARARLEAAALGALALTHLFGFIFIAAWWWVGKRRLGPHALWFLPAIAWLGMAAMVGLAARNPVGAGMGPTFQAMRMLEVLYDLVASPTRALHHVYAFLLSLLLLNPVLLERVWLGPHRRAPWAIGGGILAVVLFTGPPFLRFGIILWPIALVLGLERAAPRLNRRTAVLALAVGAAALTSAAAYVNSGLDPNAQNDVPGLLDWEAAVQEAMERNATVLAVPAPPPVAYYLMHEYGFTVDSRDKGPDLLRLSNGTTTIEVRGAGTSREFLSAGEDGAVMIVPWTRTGILAALFREGYDVCGRVDGAYLLYRGGADCERLEPLLE